jgi:PKD repeat protein
VKITATAANQPPVANAGPDQIVIVNNIVAFDGSSSTDPDGTIASYAWDFGDTKTGSGVTTSHAYTTAGTYTVTLTVTDNGGLTGSDSATITLKTPAQTLQDLIIKVKGLGLPKGIEQGFLAKLDVAEKKITQEQYTPARNTLNAFINEVNAQRGKAITASQANELTAIAQRIINSIPGK